jgi:tetratricopeptide (TPR) repeat protein
MFLNKIYMSKKDYDQAESACRRALEATPDFPDALFHLAQAQMRKAAALLQEAERNLSQSKASFQSYRGIVDADRSILDWKADLSLADLTRISGKQAEAKAMYEKILEKHPGLGSVRKKLER